MTNWEKWIEYHWKDRAKLVCHGEGSCEDCPFIESCNREGYDGVTELLDKEYEPTKKELSLKISLLENRIRELEQALTRAEEKATRAEVHCTQGRC